MASRLIRLLASGLILNATFPLDAWVATTPVGVAQPAPAQPFNEEQLDALDSLPRRGALDESRTAGSS